MIRRTIKLLGRRISGCWGRATKKRNKRIANKATRKEPMAYSEEQQADYQDYEDNIDPKDYKCPYCGSPSPDMHDSKCPVNNFGDSG